MIDEVRDVLRRDDRVAYALVFGSVARGVTHAGSDLDVALGLRAGRRPTAIELGEIASRIEAAAGRRVDLVIVDEAPPALAYRIFRDGRPLVVHDRSALVARKARAILDYLDFRPVEEACARGILTAAARGR